MAKLVGHRTRTGMGQESLAACIALATGKRSPSKTETGPVFAWFGPMVPEGGGNPDRQRRCRYSDPEKSTGTDSTAQTDLWEPIPPEKGCPDPRVPEGSTRMPGNTSYGSLQSRSRNRPRRLGKLAGGFPDTLRKQGRCAEGGVALQLASSYGEARPP